MWRSLYTILSYILLLSSFTEGVPLCYQRCGQVYKRRTGALCVYNDKEVSKVTLDRSSPRIINGKSLIMTPRYILIPDPIQFYNHLIRIVSLSLVDAFLCSYYLFYQRRCNFHKAFYLN